MSRLRDVLGGRWATGLRLWIVLVIPSILAVVAQESLVPGVTVLLVVTSIVGQHAITAVPLLIADLIRRSRGRRPMPLWGFVVTWVSVAILRALVGGAIAFAMVGASPDFWLRILFWLGVVIVWIPPFLFALTLRDFRVELVSSLIHLRTERDTAESETLKSEASLRAELVGTVYSTVMPVVDDIRHSLTVARASFDGDSLRAIGERLATVTADASRIVTGDSTPDRGTPDEEEPSLSMRDLAFERIKPVPLTVLAAVTLGLLIMPLEWGVGGGIATIHGLIAVAAMSVALGLLLLIGSWVRSATVGTRILLVAASAILAGVVGSVTLTELRSSAQENPTGTLALLFPLFVLSCTSVTSAIAALGETNNLLRREMEVVRMQFLTEVETKSAIENRVRSQLATVLHGPVYGRLSACVMALNFAAAEGLSTGSTRGRALTEGIIAHLESASIDLDELAKASVT